MCKSKQTLTVCLRAMFNCGGETKMGENQKTYTVTCMLDVSG